MPVDKTGRPTQEESELQELEDVLEQLLEDEASEVAPNDAQIIDAGRDVTPTTSERVLGRLRATQEIRKRLHDAWASTDTAAAFPRLLADLRAVARVEPSALAACVKMPVKKLHQLESGEVDPLELSPIEVARVMETFGMRFATLEHSLKRDQAVRSKHATLSSPSARATGTMRRGDLERIMRDVAGALATRDGNAEDVELPAGYLDDVRELLERWGRTDLL